MAINVIKFSQFASVNLANTTNMLVGVSAPSGGINFQQPNTVTWTTATRPGTPYNGLLGYNSSLSQYEYWNGAAWVQIASGGSGTINTGALNQLAFYSTNPTGTALSGLTSANNAVLVTSSSGVPSFENTGQIPGTPTNNNANAGNIGEFIFDQILNSAAVNISLSTISQSITNISLTAGDWDVSGNIFFTISGNCTSVLGGISSVNNALPDLSLCSQIQSNNHISGTNGISIYTSRLSISSTQTIYLVANSTFTTGTVTASGIISARRAR